MLREYRSIIKCTRASKHQEHHRSLRLSSVMRCSPTDKAAETESMLHSAQQQLSLCVMIMKACVSASSWRCAQQQAQVRAIGRGHATTHC